MPSSSLPTSARVPVRTIVTAIALVLATALLLLMLREVQRVVVWMIVAVFFAVALYPVVDWVERRVTRGRRALATLLVFLLVVVVLGGLVSAFVVPFAREGTDVATELPQQINDARAGRGPVGHLLERTNALTYVENNEDRINAFVSGLTAPAAGVLQGVATGVVGAVTIFVLAYLMVLEGPKVVEGSLNLLDPDDRARVRSVAADCAKSITGYLSGNLLISVICGVLTYVTLLATGVPFAALIALFVAVADLIPLVGATIGAVVAVVAAAIHSVPALIVVAVFVVVYQLLEHSHGEAQPADRAGGHPPRRGARRARRRLPCHPGRRDDAGDRSRPLGQPPRPPQGRADRRRGPDSSRRRGPPVRRRLGVAARFSGSTNGRRHPAAPTPVQAGCWLSCWASPRP
jgi:predicted PurR-regulated permease PerM